MSGDINIISPFIHKKSGGDLIRVDRGGTKKGSVSFEDHESIIKYITDLDEQLWRLRRIYSVRTAELEAALKSIKIIIDKVG